VAAGDFFMYDGTITGNGSSGVYIQGTAMFEMSGGTITENNATFHGGGVDVEGGSFTMSASAEISGNLARSGGGVYVAFGNFTMRGGEISGNTSTGIGSLNGGGGVRVSTSGTFTMEGGTISGNETTGEGGGGVYVRSGTFKKKNIDTGESGTIYGDIDNIHNTGDSENTATTTSGYGHAVYVNSGSLTRDTTAGPTVTLDSTTAGILGGWEDFTSTGITAAIGDPALASGGTITLPAGTYDMTATVTVSADITITTEPGAEVILKRASGFGNMITVSSGDHLTLQASTGGSLALDGNGGVVTDAAGSLVRVESAGELIMETGATLQKNKTTGNGSGVFVNTGGTFTMNDGTISGNTTSSNHGGGVYMNGGDFTMEAGTISGNEAAIGTGGGVYVNTGTFDMIGGTIGGEDDEDTNTAGGNGGGVFVNTGGTFKMSGTSAVKNNSGNNGGGVSVSGGTFTMNGAGPAVTENTSTTDGGGVYATSGGKFTMTGGSITLNEAGGKGGGMYNYAITSLSTMTNVTISGNTATGGGGMYNDNNSSPVLTNVTISGNTVTASGADGRGGGMSNNSSSAPVLTNVTISGNTVTATGSYGYGGGICNYYSSPVLVNVLISGNRVTGSGNPNYGGGIANDNNCSPKLINVTIAGNEVENGSGGGMYNIGSSPIIRNSIIWGNTATVSDWGISGSADKIGNSIVEGGLPPGTTDENNNVTSLVISPFEEWIDPSTASTPNSDGKYWLNDETTNPAKNAGDNARYPNSTSDATFPTGLSSEATTAIDAALNYDLRGSDRFYSSGAIDMGAYEYQGP
jgi:hypothetical protein